MADKLRLDLFTTGDDLTPQPHYLDRIIEASRPLAIVAIENEELDVGVGLVTMADVREDMLQSLRATTRPCLGEVVHLPHSLLIDDFKTILRPQDPGVPLFIAALEGDRERMDQVWETMPEGDRLRYAILAAEALALAPDFFGYRHRIAWLDPMLSYLDLDQLADRVMPTAALEVKAKQDAEQMREVISFQMKSSEGSEIVPKRRGGERR